MEQGAHLGITRAGGVENGKVQGKGDHVDEERNNDETHDASREVGSKDRLQMCKQMAIHTGIPRGLLTIGILLSPYFLHRSSIV